MNKIHICAVRGDRKRILEYLQLLGCVEIQDGPGADAVFERPDTSQIRAQLQKYGRAAHDAVGILAHHGAHERPKLSFLRGRSPLTEQQYEEFRKRSGDALSAADRAIAFEGCIAESRAALIRLETQRIALEGWASLPVPQSYPGGKRTAVFIGSVDGQYAAGALLERLAEADPGLDRIHVEIVSSCAEQTSFYLVALKEDAARAQQALGAIGFALPATPSRRAPAEEQRVLLGQKEQAEQAIRAAEEEIAGLQCAFADIELLEDHLKMREEKYEMIERLAQSRHAFVLQGFLPAKESERLQKKLTERFDCAIQIESAADDADAPVALQNSAFSEAAETVLENYSMPARGEIDPTPVMSFFYYMMFGLMFGDAGYGLIMAAACGAALLMFKGMESNWKRNIKLFFWCGVSTTFWGVIFSSYFGDALQVISRTFFGHEIGIPPVWFAPLDRPMQMLIFCLGLGILHLFAGYLMKAANHIKNRHYIDILYDVVFQLTIAVCMVLVLMGSDMFRSMAGFQLSLSAGVTNGCMIAAVISILGILLTGGRESRNWFKRLLKGIYALYNVLAGWISDILSYSRLLALGLASGVIATVFNALGAMTGNGIIGAIAFTVIFAAGHALNFGINALGAYVHSNRLEFVEFFGKFYEGGGRKFAPYGIHTKHYRIVEEENIDV